MVKPGNARVDHWFRNLLPVFHKIVVHAESSESKHGFFMVPYYSPTLGHKLEGEGRGMCTLQP